MNQDIIDWKVSEVWVEVKREPRVIIQPDSASSPLLHFFPSLHWQAFNLGNPCHKLFPVSGYHCSLVAASWASWHCSHSCVVSLCYKKSISEMATQLQWLLFCPFPNAQRNDAAAAMAIGQTLQWGNGGQQGGNSFPTPTPATIGSLSFEHTGSFTCDKSHAAWWEQNVSNWLKLFPLPLVKCIVHVLWLWHIGITVYESFYISLIN